MQPCSREMQAINSLLNSSQIPLPDVDDLHQIQNQNPQMHPRPPPPPPHLSHFHPSSHDDFLDQMLSNLPSSSSWPDLNPKPFWDDNVAFPYDDQATLASKFRNHQISADATSPSPKPAFMLQPQHHLLVSRGVAGAGDSALLPMPLALGGGDVDRSRNDVVDGSSFKSPNPGGEGSAQAVFNGFAGSVHGGGPASNPTPHFPHPQGQNIGAPGTATNQAPASGAPAQPRQRVRARRGQATDPHSIAERLRRERIAERMKALQELVPNANKTDKASMLDEIIDYVKFLQLQVKVLSMSRLGGAAAVAPLVADMASEQGGGGGDCVQATANGGAVPRTSNGNQTPSSISNDSLTMTEHQVAKLMEEDMGSAMQYLQGKGLCLMPISLATAISTATCHSRNPLINGPGNNQRGPSSPSMSVLTVQSAAAGNGGGDTSVKDATSVSKP